MPKEQKKRGRREEKKRKREEDVNESPLKRQKSNEPEIQHADDKFVVEGDAGNDFIGFHEKADPLEAVFYGLLDEEEQEYYSSINSKLELNDFADAEEREAFIDAIYRESNGKELKIACSQSCSRFLERLILVSNPAQLRALFAKFSSQFLHLVQHRFASHCCETLFVQSARYLDPKEKIRKQQSEDGSQAPTFEELFIGAVKDLSDNLGYLLTERFASHTIRVLLIVLSGEPLDQGSTDHVISSRKKEKIEVSSVAEPPPEAQSAKRELPASFTLALKQMISSATASLNTTYLRALATHPTGNPVLQVIIRLELNGVAQLNIKDENSVFKRLFPEDSFEEGSDSAKFAQGLLYDPSGSRLMEIIVQNASGKVFKKLYKNLWKERMAILAKNDIASYVAMRIIQRLGKDEIANVQERLVQDIPELLERNRVALVKTLIERGQVRQIEMKPLLPAMEKAYGVEPTDRLLKMLKANLDTDSAEGSKSKVDLHGSLLAQAILQAETLNSFLHTSLLALSGTQLLQLAVEPSASRVIQVALQPSASPTSFRRQFIPLLLDHIVDLATDVSGSHVVDALWDGTSDLHFMKERVARELQSHEAELRDSRYGRVVWRNWLMDTFLRRKAEWQARAKGKDNEQEDTPANTKKLGIELARARHAAKLAQTKTKGNSSNPGPSTVSASA